MSDLPPAAIALSVDATIFASALRPILKTTGIGRKKVAIAYRDGKMIVGFDEMRVSIPAAGYWPGVAEVSRGFVRTIAHFDLDKLSTIEIKYHKGEITILTTTEKCKWIEAKS